MKRGLTPDAVVTPREKRMRRREMDARSYIVLLNHLNEAGTLIVHSCMHKLTASRVSSFIRRTRDIKTLSMRNPWGRFPLMPGVLRSLEGTSIRRLDLQCCSLDTAAAVALGAALGETSRIESVALAHSPVNDYIGPLAEALVLNTSIKELSFEYAIITNEDAARLAFALTGNVTIESFAMFNMTFRLNYAAWNVIISALATTRVRRLSIRWPQGLPGVAFDVLRERARAIIDTIFSIPCLKTIDVSHLPDEYDVLMCAGLVRSNARFARWFMGPRNDVYECAEKLQALVPRVERGRGFSRLPGAVKRMIYTCVAGRSKELWNEAGLGVD